MKQLSPNRNCHNIFKTKSWLKTRALSERCFHSSCLVTCNNALYQLNKLLKRRHGRPNSFSAVLKKKITVYFDRHVDTIYSRRSENVFPAAKPFYSLPCGI